MNIKDIYDCFKLNIQIDTSLDISMDRRILGYSTDTRTLNEDEVFIALRGENFDGHEFLSLAEQKGAILAIVDNKNEALNLPQIVVNDTYQALGKLASFYRQRLNTKFIALTGSNGKTSVKEFIANILPQPSYATVGNLNNHIGVPLSMLRIPENTHYAVLELGANHLGEIGYTASIVRPDVALINNIAPAHIGEFGSIEGVANAKGEIYSSLSDSGVAIVNDDDNYAHHWDDIIKNNPVCRFSKIHKTDIYATDIEFDKEGCAKFHLHINNEKYIIQLKVPGEHMVSNALAAASCCVHIGIDINTIISGLEKFQGVMGRLQKKTGLKGATILDDTYNANLNSMLAGLAVLAKYNGKKVFVMGDMGELGEYCDMYHQQVGEAAKQYGIDSFYAVGQHVIKAVEGFGPTAQYFKDKSSLISALKPNISSDFTILVKGSRSAKMEEIVQALTE